CGDAEHLVGLEGDRPDRQAHDEGDDGVAGGAGAGEHHPPDEESDDERAEDTKPDGVEDRHPSSLPSSVSPPRGAATFAEVARAPVQCTAVRRRHQPNRSVRQRNFRIDRPSPLPAIFWSRRRCELAPRYFTLPRKADRTIAGDYIGHTGSRFQM